LVPIIDGMLASGQAATAGEAALQLAKQGRVYSHGGTIDSIARRLARRYLARCIGIPRRAGGESGSMAPMQNATHAEPATDTAKLLARMAALEARDASYRAALEAMAERVAESELMMAQLLDDGAKLQARQRTLEAKLLRLGNGVNRYVTAAEERLKRLREPPSASSSKH
jgi:hypothetical protein